MAILECRHVAITTETKSTYIMIESTFQFDDIGVVPGLLLLLWAVQRSSMQSRNIAGHRLGTRLVRNYILSGQRENVRAVSSSWLNTVQSNSQEPL